MGEEEDGMAGEEKHIINNYWNSTNSASLYGFIRKMLPRLETHWTDRTSLFPYINEHKVGSSKLWSKVCCLSDGQTSENFCFWHSLEKKLDWVTEAEEEEGKIRNASEAFVVSFLWKFFPSYSVGSERFRAVSKVLPAFVDLFTSSLLALTDPR